MINPPRLQQMSEQARAWHVDGAANIVNELIHILDEKSETIAPTCELETL